MSQTPFIIGSELVVGITTFEMKEHMMKSMEYEAKGWKLEIARLGLALLVGVSLVGAAAAEEDPRPTVSEEPVVEEPLVEEPLVEEPGATAGPRSVERFHVVRNGFTKKVRIREEATAQTSTMKYKGIPWSRGSAVNLVANPDRYEKSLHRVRYRFTHPLSGEPLVLKARSTSHRVRKVPVRSENSAPSIQIFEGGPREDEESAVGSLSYDYHSKILFSGQLRQQKLEIERVSPDSPMDRGFLKYFLFPFPVKGDYVVWIDGQASAWFTQGMQKGVKSPYELSLAADLEPELREDAMLAFLLFDLMGDFVSGAD